MSDLERLLRPKSIAVVGGGTWCSNVIRACEGIGFEGEIWPVHPSKPEIAGKPCFASIADLPAAPDASFVGVNRLSTISCLNELSQRAAGGAVCFASGFAEAQAELEDGGDLQAQLLSAAGDMPILGPNCYGLLNYLDGAALWPDQHGGVRVQSGAAIVTQSSNIAINLTMQNRGLPLAYVVTAGNQAQTDSAEIGMELLRDPRVTCLGIHIEGINNIRSLEALAKVSRELRKPICAIKIGRSDQAQLASVSHTASLAGSHAGARALLARLGIAQAEDLPGFLEVLKIWHVAGPLSNKRLASASCSGGEASLIADLGYGAQLEFPALEEPQKQALRQSLGPKVALANPLDYHTYIWNDRDAMRATFQALFNADIALGMVVLDFPRDDRCSHIDWENAVQATIACAKATNVPVAMLASLPETMPETVANSLVAQGVIPLCGMDHAMRAISLAQQTDLQGSAILLPRTPIKTTTLSEAAAKEALAKLGLNIPKGLHVQTAAEAAENAAHLRAPLVLKGVGLAHKTDAHAVRLNLASADEVLHAAEEINTETYLIEEMIENPIIELLIAVTLDPAHGYVLTLGAGGTHTELLQDTATLILPVSSSEVSRALAKLRCAPVFDGYRGALAIDREALWLAIDAVQQYVIAHHGQVQEVEINPLICTPDKAIAVDALIVQGELS